MLAMSQLGHSRQNGLSARRPFLPPDSDRTVDTAVCANAPFCTSAAIYFGKSEILLPIRPKSLHNACRPGPHKGAFGDRHERKVGMRWTRAALLTRALFLRTVKSCGPDAPTLASSSREASFLGAMVARKPGHQGERE